MGDHRIDREIVRNERMQRDRQMYREIARNEKMLRDRRMDLEIKTNKLMHHLSFFRGFVAGVLAMAAVMLVVTFL